MIPHAALGPVFALLGTMAAAGAVTGSLAILRPNDVASELPTAPPPALASASLPLPAPSTTAPALPPCLRQEIRFAPSSTTIDAEAQTHLVELAQWLEDHEGSEVTVDGHADATGPVDVNLWVSHERAAAVATILARHGVARPRIQVRAFGSYRPLAGTAENDRRQRRVDLEVSDSTCARTP